MNLCKQCGVEVEEGARRCPLCLVPLQPGAEKEPCEPPPAPPPDEARRGLRRWLLEVFTLLAATAALVVFAADFATGLSLTWARYPLAAIAFAWATTMLLMLGAGRLWLCLPAVTATICLLLFALDAFAPGPAWFFPLALPLTLLAGTILGLALAIVRILSLSPFAIIATAMLAAGLFVLGLELLLNRHFAGRLFVSWSAVAFACTLPLVVLLSYLRRRFKSRQEELRKLFHL